jgi:peptidoglycan/LPS O-acetylase OafA/YrhL
LQNNQNKQLYFPLLDTTRFIAFIPVFLTHCFITSNGSIENANWFKQITHFLDFGLLGLDYFFVLSSFLITRLFIDERHQFKTFSFKLFFIRRSLRIWPLYFLMVGIGFISFYAGLINTPLPPLIHFVSFTLNLYIAENGYHFLFFLVFLWSISVEEQFYIFWGIILNVASKINARYFQYCIPVTAFLLIALSLCYRYAHREDELKLYFHTFSVTANFGIGILVAYLSAYSKWFIPLLQRMSKLSILLLFIILLLSVLTYTIVFTHPFAILFERVYFRVNKYNNWFKAPNISSRTLNKSESRSGVSPFTTSVNKCCTQRLIKRTACFSERLIILIHPCFSVILGLPYLPI